MTIDAREHVRRLPPGLRHDLLRLLTSDSRVRADAIRQVYERPDLAVMADVLMGIEADELLRFALVELLRSETVNPET
jgi:hypothetical protein